MAELPKKQRQDSREQKGLFLKQVRESKGLSLQAVHEATKIPMDVLPGLKERWPNLIRIIYILTPSIEKYESFSKATPASIPNTLP